MLTTLPVQAAKVKPRRPSGPPKIVSDTITGLGDVTLTDGKLIQETPKPKSDNKLLIVQPNMVRLQAEQKRILAEQRSDSNPYRSGAPINDPDLVDDPDAIKARRNFKRSIGIDIQLDIINEPPPKGFNGLFENLPVLRIRRNVNPNQPIEKWFYLGQAKDDGREGYSFVNVIQMNGKNALNYLFLKKKDEEGLKLTTGFTIEEATKTFKGPDLKKLNRVIFMSRDGGNPITWNSLGKFEGKYTIVRRTHNGVLDIRKGVDVDKFVRDGLAIIDEVVPTKKAPATLSAPTHNPGPSSKRTGTTNPLPARKPSAVSSPKKENPGIVTIIVNFFKLLKFW